MWGQVGAGSRAWHKGSEACLRELEKSPETEAEDSALKSEGLEYFHDKRFLLYILSYYMSYNMCVHAKSLQSCPTLSDPMDYSPPGSSVHGILQARMLGWVAMPSSRESS